MAAKGKDDGIGEILKWMEEHDTANAEAGALTDEVSKIGKQIVILQWIAGSAGTGILLILAAAAGLSSQITNVNSALTVEIHRATDQRIAADDRIETRVAAVESKILDSLLLARAETSKEIQQVKKATDSISLVIRTETEEDSKGFAKWLSSTFRLAGRDGQQPGETGAAAN